MQKTESFLAEEFYTNINDFQLFLLIWLVECCKQSGELILQINKRKRALMANNQLEVFPLPPAGEG
jgi:hypothetical protein